MHSVLETCPAVVPLKTPSRTAKVFGGKTDFVEGNVVAPWGYRNLNGPHSMEANMEHVYADPKNYNWNYIKSVWEENWANNNPYATVKLQKTPADIFRIQMITPYFEDLKWIISVRNPYAYVESIMRKATFFMDPQRQLDQICFHVLRTLEIQLSNKQLLGDSAYVMTYEDFADNPEKHRDALIKWNPELEYMNLDAELMVKGHKISRIYDDSEEKIARWTSALPDIIPRVNEYFSKCEPLLNQWGYALRS